MPCEINDDVKTKSIITALVKNKGQKGREILNGGSLLLCTTEGQSYIPRTCIKSQTQHCMSATLALLWKGEAESREFPKRA